MQISRGRRCKACHYWPVRDYVHNKDHSGSQPINKEFSSKVISKSIAKHPAEKVLRQLLSTKQDKHSSNMYHSLWPLDLEASNFSGDRPARSRCASTLCTFTCQRDCPGRHISTDHLAIWKAFFAKGERGLKNVYMNSQGLLLSIFHKVSFHYVGTSLSPASTRHTIPENHDKHSNNKPSYCKCCTFSPNSVRYPKSIA